MCRCRDTERKRCRVIYSTPEPFSFDFAASRKRERLAVRREMEAWK